MVKSTYESPEAWIIKANIKGVFCTSPLGQTEPYGQGDTSGWFNND